MIFVVLLGFGICSMGLQKGVEKMTKIMMSALFLFWLFMQSHYQVEKKV